MINIPVFYTQFLGKDVNCPALCIPERYAFRLIAILEHEDFNFMLTNREYICLAVVRVIEKNVVGGRNRFKASDAFRDSMSDALAPDCTVTSYMYREFKLETQFFGLTDDEYRSQTVKLREDWVAHIVEHLKIGHKDGTPD